MFLTILDITMNTENLTHMVYARIPATDHAELKRLSKAKRMTISQLIRNALLESGTLK